MPIQSLYLTSRRLTVCFWIKENLSSEITSYTLMSSDNTFVISRTSSAFISILFKFTSTSDSITSNTALIISTWDHTCGTFDLYLLKQGISSNNNFLGVTSTLTSSCQRNQGSSTLNIFKYNDISIGDIVMDTQLLYGVGDYRHNIYIIRNKYISKFIIPLNESQGYTVYETVSQSSATLPSTVTWDDGDRQPLNCDMSNIMAYTSYSCQKELFLQPPSSITFPIPPTSQFYKSLTLSFWVSLNSANSYTLEFTLQGTFDFVLTFTNTSTQISGSFYITTSDGVTTHFSYNYTHLHLTHYLMIYQHISHLKL